MLPLLIITPFTLRIVFPNFAKPAKIPLEDLDSGELVLFKNSTQFHSHIFSVSGRYILFHAIRVS